MNVTPDFNAFKRLARKGNLIAVSRSIAADLETPVSGFLKLARREKNAFLLESAEQEEKIGRYSIIGTRPEAVLTSQGGRVTLSRNGRSVTVRTNEDLTGVLEKTFSTYKLANPEELPGFCGGFIGYLAYEHVQNFETIRLTSKKGRKIPDGVFFLAHDLLIFDHFRKTLTFLNIVNVERRRNLKALYRRAERKIEGAIRQLQKPFRQPAVTRQVPARVKIHSNITKRAFEKKVRKIKEYIRAGDCIQVVLSQRFTLPTVKDDFQIYRSLRSVNPSPYMFYFRAGKLRLIGSSPELLVKKAGKEAEVRPIAGTRPRGTTPAQDEAHEENLKRSTKEMAEHLMLVDLGRNDLGRVCEFESVKVKDFARVERYSHVMHLVSDVVGKLKGKRSSFDLLRATFPAGTVSGAPKIRAMQIIDELEPEERGPYAGCLGYFSFNQEMEMCITIRTLVVHGRKIDVQAGAGIVKDSNPAREYDETVNKAKALMKAFELRESF